MKDINSAFEIELSKLKDKFTCMCRSGDYVGIFVSLFHILRAHIRFCVVCCQLTIVFFSSLSTALRAWLFSSASERIVARLRKDLFSHLIHQVRHINSQN